MILDIARHKFYEGIIYLTIVAITAVVIGFVSLDDNIAQMEAAFGAVTSMSITKAVRSTSIDGVKIDDPKTMLSRDSLSNEPVIKKGKKVYKKVTL
mgnify:CR=1 FL=1